MARLLPEARRGRGSLVLVTGEAGIGKSALVATFCGHHGAGSRSFWGRCDPIEPPRPFAPLVDIAVRVDGTLRAALATGDRDRVLDAALGWLRHRSGPPTIIVLEDLHWADEATLDLVRTLARRIRDMPVVLIGTFRDDEVDLHHPLRRVLGDLASGVAERIDVPPLSRAAVARLVDGSGLDVGDLHALTAGNPFFVTEVLAAPADTVPTAVSDAVIARFAALSPPAQDVARVAAVLGDRCGPDLLLAVHGRDDTGLQECLDRRFLREDGTAIRFRHELARRAVLDVVGDRRRARYHARALQLLRHEPTLPEPGNLAYHALHAGDTEALLEFAPAAGRRAAQLGAHREAVAHFAAALRHRSMLDDWRLADLLESHATQCALIDDIPSALASQEEALACWRRTGDRTREGACLRGLSSIRHHAGDGDAALATAEEAVGILEEADPSGHELALGLAVVAQRVLTGGHDDPGALRWAWRAHDLADQLHDEPVLLHALTTIGVLEIYMTDDSGWARLHEAVRRARAAGLVEAAARAIINLVEAAIDLRRYDLAVKHADDAVDFMEAHDFDFYHRILRVRRAEIALEQGRWHAAEDEARTLLAQSGTASRIEVRALTILGRVAARRGHQDPWISLDEALARANPWELQELIPLRAACAEACWLAGDQGRARAWAMSSLEAARAPSGVPTPWSWAEPAFWSWRTGAVSAMPDDTPSPYRLQGLGDLAAAALAWRTIGCPYHEAMALVDSSVESELRHAHRLLVALEARPLARVVAERLRQLGAGRIPRGPRRSTRRNPAGLTDRQMEVLACLREGLRNSDIAERLVLSPKTVDHHVSAVLRKLGARDRSEALRIADRPRLQDGVWPGAT
jgi:DNA-binding CsgD family transcriptional regulator